MLTGNNFPMNVRQVHLLAEELLWDVISKGQLRNHGNFMSVLEDLALKSHTAKMWVDVFIKPVLMMLYVRAE